MAQPPEAAARSELRRLPAGRRHSWCKSGRKAAGHAPRTVAAGRRFGRTGTLEAMWHRRLLLACVLLAPLSAIAARPAFACSCASGPPQFARGQTVFVATVTGKTTAWWRLLNTGTDYRMDVERVIQGRVHRTAWVTASRASSGSCGGFGARVGSRVGIVVSGGGPFRFKGNLCSPRRAVDVLAAGHGHPPAPDYPGIVGHWAWEATPIGMTVGALGLAGLAVRRRLRADRRVG